MTREIVSDFSQESAAGQVAPIVDDPPMTTPREHVPEADAFSGSLPGWDLLPASPFVRRVK